MVSQISGMVFFKNPIGTTSLDMLLPFRTESLGKGGGEPSRFADSPLPFRVGTEDSVGERVEQQKGARSGGSEKLA